MGLLRVYLVEDIDKVVRVLQKEGYVMVDHKELFRRLNPIETAQNDRCPTHGEPVSELIYYACGCNRYPNK